MKFVVIKYPDPGKAKQKEETFFLIRAFKTIAFLILKLLTFWIPRSNRDYEEKLDHIKYWLIEIESDTGIAQREIGFDAWNRAILFAPTDRNMGLWADSNMIFNTEQFPNIENELFNDIFEAMEAHNMVCITDKIKKYDALWTINPTIEVPLFPILIFDLTNFNEFIYCDSSQKLTQTNLTAYEWDPETKCIDSRGFVYTTKYLNFGHPVGCVVPDRIEQKLEIAEFKTVLTKTFENLKSVVLESKTFNDLFKSLDKLAL